MSRCTWDDGAGACACASWPEPRPASTTAALKSPCTAWRDDSRTTRNCGVWSRNWKANCLMLRPDPILLFAFSFAIWEQNCSAVDQEPKQSLYEQVSQNEDMWKAGKTSEYYQRATEIIKDIKGAAASGRTNLNEVAATLLDNLLSKEVRIEEVDDHFEVEDLSAMERVAGYLNLRQASSANERQRVGRLLSRYLGRIRKELIPDFKPNPTVQNVIPPPGTPGPMIAGMDPDAIDDPVA